LADDHQPAWPNREAAAAARLLDTVAYTKDSEVSGVADIDTVLAAARIHPLTQRLPAAWWDGSSEPTATLGPHRVDRLRRRRPQLTPQRPERRTVAQTGSVIDDSPPRAPRPRASRAKQRAADVAALLLRTGHHPSASGYVGAGRQPSRSREAGAATLPPRPRMASASASRCPSLVSQLSRWSQYASVRRRLESLQARHQWRAPT
jgi:hypothetical protein